MRIRRDGIEDGDENENENEDGDGDENGDEDEQHKSCDNSLRPLRLRGAAPYPIRL
jgi:hypothetical protein